MSRADQEKWDKRFAAKPMRVPSVPAFVAERLVSLPIGRVLDLACGDGAASLALAGVLGNHVTAADVSPQALVRLEQFAQQQGVSPLTHLLDVDDPQALAGLGADADSGFDAIVVCHFKPSEALFKQLLGLLVEGGQLLLSTFNLQHHRLNGFSSRFCLAPEQYLPLPKGFVCDLYRSVERGGSYMDDYLITRKVLVPL